MIFLITFIIGLVILIVGAAIYGSFCERVMKPNASVQTSKDFSAAKFMASTTFLFVS